MNQSEIIEAHGRVLAAMHQGGLAASLRQRAGLTAAQIAKQCGTAPEVVYGWETGTGPPPTTAEGARWMLAIHESAPNPLVTAARSQAEHAEAEAAHQDEQAKRCGAIDESW